MFTPKVNSKQKCAKKMQEHETWGTVTAQLAAASSSTRHGEFPQAALTSGSPPARMAICDRS